MRIGRSIIFCLLTLPVTAQPRVLHFTRTTGFDHNTRVVSFALFVDLAAVLGAVVDDDATGDPFSDPTTLATYDVIVFSNTSGDAILNPAQRANFEQWVAAGGHVLGIHAASDTYRHSTANGSNTGTWDFYAELIGACVQQNPNHVAGTPPYAISHIGSHPSTAALPDPWVKNEEYYYWEGGYYGTDNVEVLRVEETLGPNGLVNSYDAPRPMSWYRELPNGSRVFYTALGHATDNYTSDILFRTHIKDALSWLLGGSTSVPGPAARSIVISPNPAHDRLSVRTDAAGADLHLVLYDAVGRPLRSERMNGDPHELDLTGIAPGTYMLRIGNGSSTPVMIIR